MNTRCLKAALALPCLLILAFSPGQTYAQSNSVITERGIVFGRGGDVELKLDIARPETTTGLLPALVLLCGNGWGYYTGDRTLYDPIIEVAAQRGYVAATVDYRPTQANGKALYRFPAQIHDVKCAVRWLRANAEKYGIDPNRIGVVGWSSGGHLALLLGLTDPSDGLEGECGDMRLSSRVQAVVNFAGAVEMISFYRETNVPARVRLLLGGTPEESPDLYGMASPLTYVSKDDPPVLTVQGDRDASCRVEQAKLLDAKMKQVGASHTLVIKKGEVHRDFFGESVVWEFLADHLKAGK